MAERKPPDQDLERALADAGKRWHAARSKMLDVAVERDALIQQAVAAGMSLRQIAAATGLSLGAVQQILQRRGRL